MRERSIGELLKVISCRIGARADADMKKIGLTFSQARVIGFISRSGGTVPQKNIEEFLGVAHPTVTGLIRRLENAGFVMVLPSEEDRRSKLVTMTDKAKTADVQLKSGRAGLSALLTKDFTKAEEKELVRLLSKLEDNLK